MVVFAGQGDARKSMELLWAPRVGAPRTGPGPKPALSVEAIVAAAMEIADTDGITALSMRAVGEKLGRTAMALYTYVPGKAELIDLMYDRALGELPTEASTTPPATLPHPTTPASPSAASPHPATAASPPAAPPHPAPPHPAPPHPATAASPTPLPAIPHPATSSTPAAVPGPNLATSPSPGAATSPAPSRGRGADIGPGPSAATATAAGPARSRGPSTDIDPGPGPAIDPSLSPATGPSAGTGVEIGVDAEAADLPVAHLPATAPGWRVAAVGLADRLWELHLRHPWLLQVSPARPVLGPGEFHLRETMLRVLAETGLAVPRIRWAVSALLNVVRGSVQAAVEAQEAARETGQSGTDWWYGRSALLGELVPDLVARFPAVAALDGGYPEQQARSSFDAGVELVLDGVAAAMVRASGPR